MRAMAGGHQADEADDADEAGGGGGEQGDQHQGLHAQSVDVDPEAAGAGFPRRRLVRPRRPGR